MSSPTVPTVSELLADLAGSGNAVLEAVIAGHPQPPGKCDEHKPHPSHPFERWERCDCGDRLIHYKPVGYQCPGIAKKGTP